MISTAPSPQTVSPKVEMMGGVRGRGATRRIEPPTALRPQAPGEDPSLYGGSTPGALGLKRLELDLKKYDLKRPDFEGIWLPIVG